MANRECDEQHWNEFNHTSIDLVSSKAEYVALWKVCENSRKCNAMRVLHPATKGSKYAVESFYGGIPEPRAIRARDESNRGFTLYKRSVLSAFWFRIALIESLAMIGGMESVSA